MKPSSWGNTVCDIREFVWAEDLDKVFEDCSLDEVRVQFSDTINLLGPDDRKIGHSYDLRVGLLNDRDLAQKVSVLRESSLDALKEEQVDVIYDLQVTWEEMLE